jgi:putative adenylate-forming enzyme
LDDLKKYQEKQLKKLIEYSIDHSEFYRREYDGFEMNSMEDFHRLPVINKKIMMDNFTDLNTCGLDLDDVMDYAVNKEVKRDFLGYYKDEYVVGLSSGTSGNKGIYVTPKAMTRRLPFVFLARSGIPLKLLPFRILFLLRVFSQGFDDIKAPMVSLKYLSTMTPIDDIIDSINDLKINILMAPPSLVRLLLPRRDDIRVPIKLIMTYAEVMEEEEKDRFKEVFHTDVIEIYQASEGQIASACKCGNLHINEDLVFVELYDDKGRAVNEAGKVATRMVVTNLVNYAQPLIRYEMNDMVILGHKCPCGSSFRVIKKILGRNDDVVYLKNRQGNIQHIFPDLISRWIITSSDNIREFRVLESLYDSLDITVDLFDYNSEAVERTVSLLKERMERELEEFHISIDLHVKVEEISLPENMSKYKRFCVEID